MILEADTVNDVVLLIDSRGQVLDAFSVRGKTRHETDVPATFYTYRSLLTPVGHCYLCGKSIETQDPCVSSGGFHAFVGVAEDSAVPSGHKAENRNIELHKICFEEFVFYLEPANRFPIHKIAQSLEV